ncbi:IclR family transcriptional regulator [Burkholderia sp. Bp9143]|uniref:IclR family transcriptional regulator domain-containing protein n=1 Tax=Burkholderia sp. Bp9143 TaxID=2184574 RepID=UPI000F5AB105|nr:IclR family transcriptional regulator C-terminal domain-containing protein [Burkholderia sp. Bp9143]RQR31419.1 IclR family transcriptional regulator [Burkholderia sp. Bp9143]
MKSRVKSEQPAGSEDITSSPVGLDPHSYLAGAMARYRDDPDFVTALARGLAVILTLSEKRKRISIAQVSYLTGIPRAAARRSLYTLTKLGFAAMDDSKHFYLRPRILTLGHAYLSTSPVAVLAQPILDQLGESLGHGCALAVLDSDEIVYLARSVSSRVLSPALNVGRRLPAFCASIGRTLLAHLPEPELENYLRTNRFQAYSKHTVTDPDELKVLIQKVRTDGYAFTSEQIEPHLCSIAVPIRDSAGNYVAGLNIIIHGNLITEKEAAERYFEPLHQAARVLGNSLIL